jgi:hypothetical protein
MNYTLVLSGNIKKRCGFALNIKDYPWSLIFRNLFFVPNINYLLQFIFLEDGDHKKWDDIFQLYLLLLLKREKYGILLWDAVDDFLLNF